MNNIKNIFPLLQENKKIIIVPHKNPDADALGSALALYQFLKQKNHQVEVISPNNFPNFLNWLPFADVIINAEVDLTKANELISQAEIIFCLDFNTLSRVDNLEHQINESKALKILIDHHQEPDDFDFVYSDTQIPATCQLIYHFIEMIGEENTIDIDMATCIYAGIITDTGNFRFSSVKPSTHLVAAKLIEKGISQSLIYSNIYENTTLNKLKLIGRMIDKIEVLEEYNTSIIHLKKEDLLAFNFEKGDTEGFVNYGLMINKCIFSVAFFDDVNKENTVKISFRSKGNFDVNALARKYFNGGGHVNAAGGISNLSMEETILKFKIILEEYKEELNDVIV